jgi:hypothetical protein
MMTDSGHHVISGREGLPVLLEGIVFLLALIPVVRRASLIVPAASPTVLITTLLFESILCFTMVLDKNRRRRAWSHRRRACKVATVDRGQQVGQLALDLFLGEIIYYPSWLRHSRSYVPGAIIEAVKVTLDTIKLKIKSSSYLFTFESALRPDGGTWGTLNILVDGSFVLSINAALSQDRWEMRGSCHTASLFIDGPWVQELLDLSVEAKECHRTRLKISREIPKGKR